jgi:hypothetical protein
MSIAESLICNAMAVVWAAIALNAVQAPLFWLLGPVGFSAVLFTLTFRLGRGQADAARCRRAVRVIMISTLAEIVVIFVGVNLLGSFGRIDLWACLLAAAVGLHFIPMAKWMPAPILYFIAAWLLLAACIGVVAPGAMRNALVGGLAAAAFWGSCGYVLIRNREA